MNQEQQFDLAALLRARKGDRSYERLSRDCGGFPTANRLQQIATKQLNEFPNPDTIRGLAMGLGTTVTEVTLASARSLGLNVRAADADAMVIAGAGKLPPDAQEAILAVARQMERLTKKARGAMPELFVVPNDAAQYGAETVS
jgi:sirohydrochlorin ferrochelatase